MTRILLVDDHASSRGPLAFLLGRVDDLTVAGEAGSVAEALPLLSDVDIAVIDLSLPDGSGIDIIKRIHATTSRVAVLVLTASEDRMDHALALEAGASGVLHKSVPIQEIIDAVHRLSSGGAVHSTSQVIELFQHVGQRRQRDELERQSLESLTVREKEILQALAWGFSDKEIAGYFNISPRTTRSHVANILGKLQVESRLQAVIVAIRCDAVSADYPERPLHEGPPKSFAGGIYR